MWEAGRGGNINEIFGAVVVKDFYVVEVVFERMGAGGEENKKS